MFVGEELLARCHLAEDLRVGGVDVRIGERKVVEQKVDVVDDLGEAQ